MEMSVSASYSRSSRLICGKLSFKEGVPVSLPVAAAFLAMCHSPWKVVFFYWYIIK
jgi:hypothetical protein